MKLFLFNPEHDMALASFSPYYKAPAEIVRMKSDLSALPAWYADPNSGVGASSSEIARQFVQQCHYEDLQLPVELVSDWKADVISPWGWDPAMAYLVTNEIGDLASLPSQQDLEQLKYLAGRQRCAQVLENFAGWSAVCGKARACSSIQEVKEYLIVEPQVILKAPWSGSGRGLSHTSSATWNANTEGWVSRILRTQGEIMVEPLYNKVVDFAMEFKTNQSGSLSFVGYSLFETDSHGNYKLNKLLSDEQILACLTRYVASDLLEQIKEQLSKTLSLMLIDSYDGYFGVDMMICEKEGGYCIHPCVEINLRMNMGVVSRLLYDRYVVPGRTGCYVVSHYNKDGEALEHDRQFRELYPTVVREHKMYSGYFPLTPVLMETRYQCYALLDSCETD